MAFTPVPFSRHGAGPVRRLYILKKTPVPYYVLVPFNVLEAFAREFRLYRNYGFSPADLPRESYVTLRQGLDDVIVPPAMAWKMAQALPRCEAHFAPGGHFVAIAISDQTIARLKQHLDVAPGAVRTADGTAR